MTIATADSDGRPWASPVYFSPAGYREFFWISEPGARHYNLGRYPAEKMRPPAAHRLYRATATGHFVLDPAGHPDGSAGDHRAPVDL